MGIDGGRTKVWGEMSLALFLLCQYIVKYGIANRNKAERTLYENQKNAL